METIFWQTENKIIFYFLFAIYIIFWNNITTLNKPKSRQVSTNYGIITQNILMWLLQPLLN